MRKYTALLLVLAIFTPIYSNNQQEKGKKTRQTEGVEKTKTSQKRSTALERKIDKSSTTNKMHNKKQKGKKKERSNEQHQYLQPDSLQFWYNALLAAFLSMAGGFCSGMTVGLNSLSTLNLQIMQKSQDKKDRDMANRIIDIIHDHHLFLVTLLVGNALVLESLPLVVHLLMPDWAAIICSTFLVLVVAEVVPMSLSTGAHKYIIAYYGAPMVRVLIICFWPLCYPMARGLDKLLGTEHKQRIYRKDFLIFINNKNKNSLDKLQIQFVNQIMNQKNKTMKQIMNPLQKMLILQINQIIDDELIHTIAHHRNTYLLVYREKKDNVVGYVKGSQLILEFLARQSRERCTLEELSKGKIGTNVLQIYEDAVAVQVLEIMNEYKTRLVLICKKIKRKAHETHQLHSTITIYEKSQWILEQGESMGVVTLDDILCQMADFPTRALRRSSSIVLQQL